MRQCEGAFSAASCRLLWYNGAGDYQTMRAAAFCSTPTCLFLLAGLTRLLGGGEVLADTLPTLLAPMPLLTLSPSAPPPAALPALPRMPQMGDATALDESVSQVRWIAQSGWSLGRENDPSLQLTGWGDVFDVALLGAFDIPLRSDPAERTNILLSARAVDGVEVDPGQTFSFNGVVGERTPERGYRDGWMFDHGKLVRGTGGGICLVATGLYNAALSAGMGVVERHPHSGLVSYAPPAAMPASSTASKICSSATPAASP